MTCQVQVKQLKSTVDEDWWTKQDPYIVVKQGSKQLIKTPVKNEGGKNVSWTNQKFTYKIKNLNEMVTFTATDQDPIWDDQIGSGSIKASDLCPLGKNKDHKVQIKKDGKHRGYIYVRTTRV